jgi:hypothetical protein
MPFYPDNIHRAGRLQQLVDSIANMQTDIEDFSEQMDRKLKRMKEPLEKLLKEEGIDSIDKLIEKSQDMLSPQQQNAFRAVRDFSSISSLPSHSVLLAYQGCKELFSMTLLYDCL